MTITPIYRHNTVTPSEMQQTQTEIPVQELTDLESVMLAQDKLYVVLAVVLIIWIGIAYFILRTDRKLNRLERTLTERIPEETASI